MTVDKKIFQNNQK